MRSFSIACFCAVSAIVGCSSSDGAANATDGATDVGNDTTVICTAPLTDVATFDDPPPAAWCAKSNGLGGRRSTKACGGYLAIVIGEGVDCSTVYLFDPGTKRLVAELRGCNLRSTCWEGPPSFVAPSDACLSEGGFAFDTTPVCPPTDAGVDASDGDAPADAGDATHD